MKFLQSSLFRALTAIVVGVLLIKYPDNTVTGIVVAIGLLFFLSGIVSLLTYWNARRHQSEYTIYDVQGRQIAGQKPVFPIVGIGSIILGGILATMPTTFISMLMYVIGTLLILGAITQFMAIISARRFGSSSLFFWVCPSLILLAGLYIILKPMAPLSTAMLLLGWLSLFYGVVEAINALTFARRRKRWEREQEQSQYLEAEEIKPEEEEPTATEAETETKTEIE